MFWWALSFDFRCVGLAGVNGGVKVSHCSGEPVAHLKAILKLDRLRLRGPCGANDEFLLAATAQNLRKMAKIYMNGRKMSTA